MGEKMKNLYMIGGSMGVGKTAVCQRLKKELEHSVFLDGDWCWDANPFQVNEETKAMVMDNICHILSNFIHCSSYENIIFGWVMHEQAIIASILETLDTRECNVKCISLLVDEKSLRERIMGDVENGIRTIDVVDRSIARLAMYQSLSTIKVDTSGKTVQEVVDEIKAL